MSSLKIVVSAIVDVHGVRDTAENRIAHENLIGGIVQDALRCEYPHEDVDVSSETHESE